jgi:hypothetical protein
MLPFQPTQRKASLAEISLAVAFWVSLSVCAFLHFYFDKSPKVPEPYSGHTYALKLYVSKNHSRIVYVTLAEHLVSQATWTIVVMSLICGIGVRLSRPS